MPVVDPNPVIALVATHPLQKNARALLSNGSDSHPPDWFPVAEALAHFP
jgi:hypothetical protein